MFVLSIKCVLSYCIMCSLSLYNVFSLYRMCSLHIEYVLSTECVGQDKGDMTQHGTGQGRQATVFGTGVFGTLGQDKGDRQQSLGQESLGLWDRTRATGNSPWDRSLWDFGTGQGRQATVFSVLKLIENFKIK